MVKIISKNLSSKYSQNILDHAKQLDIDVLKTGLNRAIQKTAEVTWGFIGNKISNKITKKSQQSTSETTERETEVPKERYISPEERQQITDELRLI